MQPLPRTSVSPLPSFCTVRPDAMPRYVNFAETVGAIWRHITGRPKPTQRELWLAERAIERLADEMEEEAAVVGADPDDGKRKTKGEGHGATTT
jgi:hypothetical protein